MKWLLLSAIAFAKDGHTVPVSDNLYWITHLSQEQVWLFLQAGGFSVWAGTKVFDYFKSATDKTGIKLDVLVEQANRQRELTSVMLEDIRNIKYTMLSKDEAHKLIEDKIEFVEKLRKK